VERNRSNPSPNPSPQVGGGSPARIDAATRRVSIDASDPAFYQDPYATFRAVRAVAPVFFWEELGIWCSPATTR